MLAYTDHELHEDHRLWTSERALWHDDVRIWQREIDGLRARLKQIDAALEQQQRDLQVHAAALTLYEQRDARREHSLVQYEQDCDDERRMLLGRVHEAEVSQHGLQRARHEDLKVSQRRLLAQLRSFARLGELGSRPVATE
ncbi:MAG TPA: hypothetical protein VF306_10685 [Pirellulales bacterium]